MKKVLFIDRDGTVIAEPPVDFQVDSLEKLSFVPGAISALKALAALDFDLVLASNQDGLGTPSFPTEQFLPPHNKMLETLAGEGVFFCNQLIDKSFEHDNAPTRKPRTGMFGDYLTGDYDLAGSFVIGDRITDMLLARNLGCKGIFFADPAVAKTLVAQYDLEDTCVLISPSWADIADFVRVGERRVHVRRETSETSISVMIDLDNHKELDRGIDTGIKFFDHMLQQLVSHGGIALSILAEGDLEVDEHHTIEDVGIALGDAIYKALGSKMGIERYGFALPMDDCRAMALIDFGGRIDFDFDVRFSREYVGDMPTEMISHFFHSLCCAAKCNLQIKARGRNNHHKAEAVFKAFARALRMAVYRRQFHYDLPSSKGCL